MNNTPILPHGVITPETGGDAWLILVLTSAGLFITSCIVGFVWFRYIKSQGSTLPQEKRTAIIKIMQIIDEAESGLTTYQHYRIWTELRRLTLLFWGEQSIKLDIDAYIERCAASALDEQQPQLKTILSKLHQAIYNPHIHLEKQQLISVLVTWIQDGIHRDRPVQQGLQL